MSANLENSAVATELEKVNFHSNPKERAMPKNVQTTTQLCSLHMLVRLCWKSFRLGFKQYMNRELPDVQAGFRKGIGTRDQIANIRWIIEKLREFQKNIYFWFINYCQSLWLDHDKVENS